MMPLSLWQLVLSFKELSIELSADAPIKPPYTVFFQGGLTDYHAYLGIMMAVQTMKDKGLITLA